ncbi:MAG: alpha-ketoglutarate-dependent dioxygenase AlkB [Phycisphaerae bacterium]|nr:alpha-ketoglutarate-dependent dioxygenase AlkB [Phycisphaerae bacterium]
MQLGLFGRVPPRFGSLSNCPDRVELSEGAWLEYLPGWLSGHAQFFEDLAQCAVWNAERRVMYQRMVDVPRLTATAPFNSGVSPLLRAMSVALSERYKLELNQISLAWYRDGHDSVAMHGDKMGPLRDNTVVAILSVGEPRRFVMRQAQGQKYLYLKPGFGDLVVMGGSCQRTWLHGIPKQSQAGPRIAIMFRQTIHDSR